MMARKFASFSPKADTLRFVAPTLAVHYALKQLHLSPSPSRLFEDSYLTHSIVPSIDIFLKQPNHCSTTIHLHLNQNQLGNIFNTRFLFCVKGVACMDGMDSDSFKAFPPISDKLF